MTTRYHHSDERKRERLIEIQAWPGTLIDGENWEADGDIETLGAVPEGNTALMTAIRRLIEQQVPDNTTSENPHEGQRCECGRPEAECATWDGGDHHADRDPGATTPEGFDGSLKASAEWALDYFEAQLDGDPDDYVRPIAEALKSALESAPVTEPASWQVQVAVDDDAASETHDYLQAEEACCWDDQLLLYHADGGEPALYVAGFHDECEARTVAAQLRRQLGAIEDAFATVTVHAVYRTT